MNGLRVIWGPPGETVTITYYLWQENGRLETQSTSFHVVNVVLIEGFAADRGLVPEYPGITTSEHLSDWDPPFPVDLKIFANRTKIIGIVSHHPKGIYSSDGRSKTLEIAIWKSYFAASNSDRRPVAATSLGQLRPGIKEITRCFVDRSEQSQRYPGSCAGAGGFARSYKLRRTTSLFQLLSGHLGAPFDSALLQARCRTATARNRNFTGDWLSSLPGSEAISSRRRRPGSCRQLDWFSGRARVRPVDDDRPKQLVGRSSRNSNAQT